MSRDLDIATLVLPAPRLALLGPLAILVVKTTLFTLIKLFVIFAQNLNHIQNSLNSYQILEDDPSYFLNSDLL